MGGGAWWATVHGVTKSRTRLSDSHFDLTEEIKVHDATSPPATGQGEVGRVSKPTA